MKLIKVFIVTILVCYSFNLKAQYYKLINLTEKQIKEKVVEFPIVIRDSSEHEFVPFLIFKNKDNEIKLAVYFFSNKCYLVKEFKSSNSINSIISSADLEFNKIAENRWRSKENTFEVSLLINPDQVMIEYIRGISSY